MRLGKVDNQAIKAGKRLIKFLGFGTKDVQDVTQALPYGIDSAPIKDMVAVYGDTATNGEAMVVGYVTKELLAETGELRLYSTDADGALKTYVWLTDEGKIQLAGDADNAVRYTKLNIALQQFKTDIMTELVAIQSGITTAGGTYTPNPTFGIDISESKIDEIQTT